MSSECVYFPTFPTKEGALDMGPYRRAINPEWEVSFFLIIGNAHMGKTSFLSKYSTKTTWKIAPPGGTGKLW